jgi:RNA polymerase sigma factor (sigma-70 family)
VLYNGRTDDELIEASRCGDESAFGVLSDRYRARMVSYVEMTAGGEADADSVVQEALMRAYAARYQYRPEAGFSAWLYTIARNETYPALKRRRTLPLESAPVATAGVPEEAVLRLERIREVRTALARLPRLQREAISLTRYGELTCEEAASALQTSNGAVRTAIYKGLKTLKRWLNENE